MWYKAKVIECIDQREQPIYTIRIWRILLGYMYFVQYPSIKKYGWSMKPPNNTYYGFSSPEEAEKHYNIYQCKPTNKIRVVKEL